MCQVFSLSANISVVLFPTLLEERVFPFAVQLWRAADVISDTRCTSIKMAVTEVGKIYYYSEKIIFWEIPNFSFLPSGKGERTYSPLFCFPPKKFSKAFKNHAFQFEPLASHVGLILSSALSLESSEQNFKLGIVNSEFEEIANCSGQWIEDEYGSGHFRVTSIVEKIKLVRKPVQYIRVFVENNSNHDSLMEERNGLEQLNLPEYLKTDLTIKVKGKEFPVHKTVLRARCELFAELLSNDPNIISEWDSKAFEMFLIFIYTDKIGCTSPRVLCELYCMAHKYIFEELKQKCIVVLNNFLAAENLPIKDFCDIMMLFLKYRESELQEHVTEYFNCNSKAIINTDIWLLAMKNYATEARNLLNDAFEVAYS